MTGQPAVGDRTPSRRHGRTKPHKTHTTVQTIAEKLLGSRISSSVRRERGSIGRVPRTDASGYENSHIAQDNIARVSARAGQKKGLASVVVHVLRWGVGRRVLGTRLPWMGPCSANEELLAPESGTCVGEERRKKGRARRCCVNSCCHVKGFVEGDADCAPHRILLQRAGKF